MNRSPLKNKKIALIEIAGSHDECLLTQMVALKEKNAHVTWITSTAMYNRCKHFHEYIDEVYFVDVTGKAIADFKKMKGIVRFLQAKQIQTVVFNTAQGGNVRNLALLLPKSIQAFGIIHTLRKFNGSFTQKIISKAIKEYVVLSDDLLKRVNPQQNIHVSSFYPVDFPTFDSNISKPENAIFVTLTGGVETRRKDLDSLLTLIPQTPAHVHFVFLGKTDTNNSGARTFLEHIENKQLQDRITWFDHFVSQETFDAYLRATDFLLPLIHPQTPSSDQYVINQISGAFLLSYGYHIPLLIHQAYSSEVDLQLSAAFYTLEDFSSNFNQALNLHESIREKIAKTEKWKPSEQHRNFLRFIHWEE